MISGKGSYFQADRGKKFCYSGKKATSARTGKALSMWIYHVSVIGEILLGQPFAFRSVVTPRNIRYQEKKNTKRNPYSLMNSVREN